MGLHDLVGRISVSTSGVGDEVPAGALPTLTDWHWHYAAHHVYKTTVWTAMVEYEPISCKELFQKLYKK
jgi:hypothetical protein